MNMERSQLTGRAANPGLHAVLGWAMPQSLLLEALVPECDSQEITDQDTNQFSLYPTCPPTPEVVHMGQREMWPC